MSRPSYALINGILRELAIPVNLFGYAYLRDAVALAVEEPCITHSMTKRLYPLVAQKHNVTWPSAERAMRHAIETAWVRGGPGTQEKYFGNSISWETGKPSNSQFIATIADWIVTEVAL